MVWASKDIPNSKVSQKGFRVGHDHDFDSCIFRFYRYVYIYIYIYININICVCVHVCIYMHIYIYIICTAEIAGDTLSAQFFKIYGWSIFEG